MEKIIFDPIENMNLTDSLKAAIRAKNGLGEEIYNHLKDHEYFLKEQYFRTLSGPIFEPRITVMHVDDNGVIDRVIFDGVEYK